MKITISGGFAEGLEVLMALEERHPALQHNSLFSQSIPKFISMGTYKFVIVTDGTPPQPHALGLIQFIIEASGPGMLVEALWSSSAMEPLRHTVEQLVRQASILGGRVFVPERALSPDASRLLSSAAEAADITLARQTLSFKRFTSGLYTALPEPLPAGGCECLVLHD